MRRISIFDFEFDVTDEDCALKAVLEWARERHRRTRIVMTVNVAVLMMARENEDLAAAIQRADLVVADGQPIVWASRWLCPVALPERVTGVDLMTRLLGDGSARGMRVFLLGTTPERLERLVAVVSQRYSGINLVGHQHGYFLPAEHGSVAARIRASRADVLLIGMPTPFKEVWAEKFRSELETPVVLGVGGAFDVMAGFVARAPEFMQNAGLEWAWRMMLEPRKLWKRYLFTNSSFLVLLGRHLFSVALHRWRG